MGLETLNSLSVLGHWERRQSQWLPWDFTGGNTEINFKMPQSKSIISYIYFKVIINYLELFFEYNCISVYCIITAMGYFQGWSKIRVTYGHLKGKIIHHVLFSLNVENTSPSSRTHINSWFDSLLLLMRCPIEHFENILNFSLRLFFLIFVVYGGYGKIKMVKDFLCLKVGYSNFVAKNGIADTLFLYLLFL